MFSRLIYVVPCIRPSFLFMAKWYHTVWIYHIFLHWSVVSTSWLSYKGCYEHVQVFVWMNINNSLGCMPGVELMVMMETLYLTCWGTAKMFSKATAPFYILTNSSWEFQFSRIITNTCYYFSFSWIITILEGTKWHLTAVLLYTSLRANVEHLFIFGKMSI